MAYEFCMLNCKIANRIPACLAGVKVAILLYDSDLSPAVGLSNTDVIALRALRQFRYVPYVPYVPYVACVACVALLFFVIGNFRYRYR